MTEDAGVKLVTNHAIATMVFIAILQMENVCNVLPAGRGPLATKAKVI